MKIIESYIHEFFRNKNDIKLTKSNFFDVMKNELQHIVPLVVNYINRFDKSFLKKIDFSYSIYGDNKSSWNDDVWYIVACNWEEFHDDKSIQKFDSFIKGLVNIINKELPSSWKKNRDFAEKKYGNIKVIIDYYGGDNDGFTIMPEMQ